MRSVLPEHDLCGVFAMLSPGSSSDLRVLQEHLPTSTKVEPSLRVVRLDFPSDPHPCPCNTGGVDPLGLFLVNVTSERPGGPFSGGVKGDVRLEVRLGCLWPI